MTILREVAEEIGATPNAIEKDLWVTLVLQVLFQGPYGKSLVFKGGTSLSKGWGLINRFSEDIDLTLDRMELGYSHDISIFTKRQINKLRRTSYSFVKDSIVPKFCEALDKYDFGSRPPEVRVERPTHNQSYPDPVKINISYESTLPESSEYLRESILLEIGIRSRITPTENRLISSLVDQAFLGQGYVGEPFSVPVMSPKRTFLEKMILLHEHYSANKISSERTSPQRLSRHLYDIHQLKDTSHGKEAIIDEELFADIITSRSVLQPTHGIDYGQLSLNSLEWLPPDSVLNDWDKDYNKTQTQMIYGDPISFETLIKSLQDFKESLKS